MTNIAMTWIVPALQIVIALGLLNVWIVRSGHATKYRGGRAQNMKQEFSVYGLPDWSMYVVGFSKILIAVVMVWVLLVPYVMIPFGIAAFTLLVVLMIGAIAMHIKVKDPFIKMLPAITMLLMSALALYLVLPL